MRNHELIKAIYDRCPDMRDGYHYSTSQYVDRCQDIIDMIEKERPEFRKDNFWKGGHLDVTDSPTFESKMEEMKKYPHQDNHMD